MALIWHPRYEVVHAIDGLVRRSAVINSHYNALLAENQTGEIPRDEGRAAERLDYSLALRAFDREAAAIWARGRSFPTRLPEQIDPLASADAEAWPGSSSTDWGPDMAKLRMLAPRAAAIAPLPQWETLARPFPVEECGLWPLDWVDVGRRTSVPVAAAEGRYMVYVVEGDLVTRQCQVEAPARAGDDLRTLTRRTERLAGQICRRAARDLARQIEARQLEGLGKAAPQ